MTGMVSFFCYCLIAQNVADKMTDEKSLSSVTTIQDFKQVAIEAEQNLVLAQEYQRAEEYEKAKEAFVESARQFLQVAQQINRDDPMYVSKQADRLAQALFAYEQAISSYQSNHIEKPLGMPYWQLIQALRNQTLMLMEIIDKDDLVYPQLVQTVPKLDQEYQRLRTHEQTKKEEIVQAKKAEDARVQAEQQILQQQLAKQNAMARRTMEHQLKIGLWTSTGLALASLATGITSSIVTSNNSILSNYIIRGAQQEGFNSQDVREICAARDQFTERTVPFNCNTHTNLRYTSVAMWTMTGIFTASTVVLTGLIIAHKKNLLASKHSKQQPQLSVAPVGAFRGAMIQGELHF